MMIKEIIADYIAIDLHIQIPIYREENEEKDCVHSCNTDHHADCFKIHDKNRRCYCTDR